jgi:hypothetical protein
MFAANTYVIRMSTEKDSAAVRRLAQLDSRPQLTGRALIGELDGEPAAALSLGDGRVVADPFRPTAQLVACLRVRAEAWKAFEDTPSLRERLRGALPAAALDGAMRASAKA